MRKNLSQNFHYIYRSLRNFKINNRYKNNSENTW